MAHVRASASQSSLPPDIGQIIVKDTSTQQLYRLHVQLAEREDANNRSRQPLTKVSGAALRLTINRLIAPLAEGQPPHHLLLKLADADGGSTAHQHDYVLDDTMIPNNAIVEVYAVDYKASRDSVSTVTSRASSVYRGLEWESRDAYYYSPAVLRGTRHSATSASLASAGMPPSTTSGRYYDDVGDDDESVQHQQQHGRVTRSATTTLSEASGPASTMVTTVNMSSVEMISREERERINAKKEEFITLQNAFIVQRRNHQREIETLREQWGGETRAAHARCENQYDALSQRIRDHREALQRSTMERQRSARLQHVSHTRAAKMAAASEDSQLRLGACRDALLALWLATLQAALRDVSGEQVPSPSITSATQSLVDEGQEFIGTIVENCVASHTLKAQLGALRVKMASRQADLEELQRSVRHISGSGQYQQPWPSLRTVVHLSELLQQPGTPTPSVSLSADCAASTVCITRLGKASRTVKVEAVHIDDKDADGQEMFFQSYIKPVLVSACEYGHDACILAYGAVGSGKSQMLLGQRAAEDSEPSSSADSPKSHDADPSLSASLVTDEVIFASNNSKDGMMEENKDPSAHHLSQDDGQIQRVLAWLTARADTGDKIRSMRIACYELIQDRVFDLIAPSKRRYSDPNPWHTDGRVVEQGNPSALRELQLRQLEPSRGSTGFLTDSGSWTVDALEVPVGNYAEALQVVQFAQDRSRMASEHSHVFMRVSLETCVLAAPDREHSREVACALSFNPSSSLSSSFSPYGARPSNPAGCGQGFNPIQIIFCHVAGNTSVQPSSRQRGVQHVNRGLLALRDLLSDARLAEKKKKEGRQIQRPSPIQTETTIERDIHGVWDAITCRPGISCSRCPLPLLVQPEEAALCSDTFDTNMRNMVAGNVFMDAEAAHPPLPEAAKTKRGTCRRSKLTQLLERVLSEGQCVCVLCVNSHASRGEAGENLSTLRFANLMKRS